MVSVCETIAAPTPFETFSHGAILAGSTACGAQEVLPPEEPVGM